MVLRNPQLDTPLLHPMNASGDDEDISEPEVPEVVLFFLWYC